jgi:probable F420-dependent oxidoreductase
MHVSVSIPVASPNDLEQLTTRAQRAEGAGIGAVYVTDHPAPPLRWLERGGHPTLDPFVALSFVAAATTTLRVHTNLVVLGYRHPLLTAKAVASLDALSGGRLILGVGVGYLDAEFRALGLDPTDRARLADDALVALRQAWTGEPFGADATVIRPRPVQQPHPPIWVGGNSMAAMRRAVAYGQAWSPMPSPASAARTLGTPGIESADELSVRVQRLHAMAAEAGRTDRVDVAAMPTTLSGFRGDTPWQPAPVLDEIGRLREAGATALVIDVPEADWDNSVDRLTADVLSQL